MRLSWLALGAFIVALVALGHEVYFFVAVTSCPVAGTSGYVLAECLIGIVLSMAALSRKRKGNGFAIAAFIIIELVISFAIAFVGLIVAGVLLLVALIVVFLVRCAREKSRIKKPERTG